MSTTLYFRGPVVWMDSCSSVFLYSHTTPFSITSRDLGISSSLLRKRWPVSWFFTAGAGNNMGSHKTWSFMSFWIWTLPPFSYPRCEEFLWTPGSAGVGLLWGSPGFSGNLCRANNHLTESCFNWPQKYLLWSEVPQGPCFFVLRVKFPLTILQLVLSPPQTPHRSSCLSEAICPSQPTCCIGRQETSRHERKWGNVGKTMVLWSPTREVGFRGNITDVWFK